MMTSAAFVVMANSPTTTVVVVRRSTFFHFNPWYRQALYQGEEVYALTSAPVGHEVEQLPPAETIQVGEEQYSYAEGSFYQQSGDKFVVVEAPVGAEVRTLPEGAVKPEEEEPSLHQFDNTFFTETANEAGERVYRVEPSPPEEELKEIPQGAVTFVADGETYYYVNYNLYVEYAEDGRKGFVNGEPEIGAQADSLPEGAATIEQDGRTFYQFDMVFFEEVQDESGSTIYEVVGSPDGSETVELASE